jgi:hypothetical protein
MPFHNHFAFDLISDLYLKDWPQTDWSIEPTSLIAVVAGDLSSDLDHTVHELKKMAKHYRQVLYIDGDLEHNQSLEKVNTNRDYLAQQLKNTKNITYMHEHVLIINDVAFIAANLWWSPGDSNTNINDDTWFKEMQMLTLHHEDLNYLRYTVQRIQLCPDIKKCVLVSHTVPNRELILGGSDENLASDASEWVEIEDHTGKIKTWCFGHWNRSVKLKVNNCEYVSNPKGKPSDSLGLKYHPLRVVV